MPNPVATINDAVRAEMTAHNIDFDNLDDRLTFITGLRDGWMEDDEKSFGKSIYLGAINTMIVTLKLRIAFRN